MARAGGIRASLHVAPRDEMEVLFNLLSHRYERGSVMITSNLPFSKWEQIFKDPMTTVAAIDRLVHHSVVLELNIPSYRLEASKKRRHAICIRNCQFPEGACRRPLHISEHPNSSAFWRNRSPFCGRWL